MSASDGKDPIKPWVSFDNYLMPEPEPEVVPVERGFLTTSTNRFLVSVGVVWVLTFALGVLTAMSFLNQGEAAPDVALMAEPTPEMPAAEGAPQTAVSETSPVYVPSPDSVPVTLTGLVEASMGQAVTRTRNTDLLGAVGPMSRIGPAGPTYAEILQGLSARASTVEQAESNRAEISNEKLRLIREGVLDGSYTVKAIKRKGQERLCLRLENADVSREEVEMILQTAIENGDFEVPEALRQESGEADLDTLLFNFVQTSLANEGTPQGAEAAREMSRRAFAASNAKTKKVDGNRVYEVQPGDSLAYISLQFYGKPREYLRIFEANRDRLNSPDRIRIGQRLIIPG